MSSTKPPPPPGSTADGLNVDLDLELDPETQQLPRDLGEASSLDLSVDVVDLSVDGFGEGSPSVHAAATLETDGAPDASAPMVVVMEERPAGLVETLGRLGFRVRSAQTGVETMSLAAELRPAWVLVGPGDGERRRVLCAALRTRIPTTKVAVVLPAGVVAPTDVQATFPWPLPPDGVVAASLGVSAGHAKPGAQPSKVATRVVPPTAALSAQSGTASGFSLSVPLLTADASATGSIPAPRPGTPLDADEAQREPQGEPTLTLAVPAPAAMAPVPVGPSRQPRSPLVLSPTAPPKPTAHKSAVNKVGNKVGNKVAGASVPPAKAGIGDDLSTLAVPRVTLPMTGDADDGPTAPSIRAAAPRQSPAVVLSSAELLRDAASLLWSLDSCARYLEDLEAHHIKGAEAHARVVRAAAHLLTELHARLDAGHEPRDPSEGDAGTGGNTGGSTK